MLKLILVIIFINVYKQLFYIFQIIQKTLMTNRQPQQLLNSSNAKFQAFKIQKNLINPNKNGDDDMEYQFQEALRRYKKTVDIQKQKENISDVPIKQNQILNKTNLQKQSYFQVKCLMNELNYPAHLNQKNQHQKIGKQLQSQCQIVHVEEDGFSQLWDMIDKQNEQGQQNLDKCQNQKLQQQKKQDTPLKKQKLQIQEKQYAKNKSTFNDSESSCEMTEEELKLWMEGCNYLSQSDLKPDGEQIQIERSSNRNKCIYMADQVNQDQTENTQLQNWGSWENIVQQLKKTDSYTSGQQELFPNYQPQLQEIDQQRTQEDDFVIIDTPLQFIKVEEPQFLPQVFPFCESGQSQSDTTQIQQKISKYGPWKYNLQHYELYSKYNISLMYQLTLDMNMSKKTYQKQSHDIYQAARPIRKINWQMMEQQKPEVRALKSKRNCKTALLIYGRDFFIFDHEKFVLNPLRQGTHTYLGIRAFQNIGQNQNSLKILDQLSHKKIPSHIVKQRKQYLYLPSNGQCLIQTLYPQKVDSSTKSKFSIVLSLTQQKIAVCQRFIHNQQNDRKEIIEVKLYDSFEKSAGQYLGIIQSKISKFSQQWYCDTIINIPKRKLFSRKINEKEWDKFKIQLRLSEMGTIVAQLGIFDAKSSVTNCILFNENKSCQFMLGTIQQSEQQINYTVRLAGISPLMGFAAAISRKMFVSSSM